MENLVELNGNLRDEVKKDISTAVSCIKSEIVCVKSEVESAKRWITELEARATETHSLLLALLDGVGGHRDGVGGHQEEEQEQEAPSGQRGNYNGNHRKAAELTNGTKIRYADAVGRNKPGNGGQEKTKVIRRT
jgi:hypothetical protein